MKNLILFQWVLVQTLLLFQCSESTNGQGNGNPLEFQFLTEAKDQIERILETAQNKDIPTLIQVISGFSAEALKVPLLQCPSEANGNFETCFIPVKNKIQEQMSSNNDSGNANPQDAENRMENCGLLRGMYYCANIALDTCSGSIAVRFIRNAVQSTVTPKLNQLGCDKSVFDNIPYVPSPTPALTPVSTTGTDTGRSDSSMPMPARTTPAPLLLSTTSRGSNGHSNHGQVVTFPFKLAICLVTFFHISTYLCNCL